MRILLVHFEHITFADRRRSNRPKDILHMDRGVESYEDVLVAFCCIEQGDTPELAPSAATEIASRWTTCKAKALSLQPFAHLSRNLALSVDAVPVLEAIETSLRSRGIPCNLGSFGFHKSAEFHALARGYAGSVAFREVYPEAAQDDEGRQ